MSDYPPPPPPPPPQQPWPQPPPQWPQGPGNWQAYAQQQPVSSGMHIGALVCGIVGIVVGLIPLFFFISLPLGIIALVLGVMAYRRATRVGVKQGRSGIVLGLIATALGVVGLLVVFDAFDELDDDLTCLGEADTSEEIDACN